MEVAQDEGAVSEVKLLGEMETLIGPRESSTAKLVNKHPVHINLHEQVQC